jgi:hypothetical protein
MTKEETEGLHIRWYHVLATVLVGALTIFAVITLIHRFDPSLVSSKRTLKFADGCSSSIDGKDRRQFVYIGVNDGDLIGPGGVKVTDEESAVLKVIELGGSNVKVAYRARLDEEWTEVTQNYGVEADYQAKAISYDCAESIYFNFSI